MNGKLWDVQPMFDIWSRRKNNIFSQGAVTDLDLESSLQWSIKTVKTLLPVYHSLQSDFERKFTYSYMGKNKMTFFFNMTLTFSQLAKLYCISDQLLSIMKSFLTCSKLYYCFINKDLSLRMRDFKLTGENTFPFL